ncbi:hypothetical protein FEE59_20280 [Herbaspirillum sp. RU 5E]|nr:hypothetical protein [Herbaspirillum sp. RU 5E]
MSALRALKIVAISVIAAAISLFLIIFWMYVLDQNEPRRWTEAELIFRLVFLPAVAFLLTVFVAKDHLTKASDPVNAQLEQPLPRDDEHFKAQVVGIQWLNPLIRRDYPTEWQLLWALGVVKPNLHDDEVQRDPAVFTTVQSIAPIAYGGRGSKFPLFFEGYVWNAIKPIGRGYAADGQYFYTIQPKKTERWKELHGIHVEFAIPDISELPKDQAGDILRRAFEKEFEFANTELSTANIPADVNFIKGGASAGFASLSAGMDYLEAHPEKTVWVMNMDAPEFPEYGRISENCTLLILAGPKFNTGREPLAWIARPAVRRVEDFATTEGESRTASAWKGAIQSAAEQAKISPYEIRYVIHDAGKGTEEAGRRIGTLAQAMTQNLPELDVLKQTFNTPQLLGDMRAGTAITNVALAIAWAHHKGRPVMVAGTTEPDKATAVMVTPPDRARVFDPEKNWFRARGEGYAYLPWWGLRKDLDWSTYMQGYSD